MPKGIKREYAKGTIYPRRKHSLVDYKSYEETHDITGRELNIMKREAARLEAMANQINHERSMVNRLVNKFNKMADFKKYREPVLV